MRITRRTVLAASAAGVATAGCSTSSPSTGELVRSRVRLPRPYQTALPRLRELAATEEDGAEVFELTQRTATAELLPGVRTRVLGYNGTFPGPLIVSRAGRETVVRHHNALDVPTVAHLHGGHTPSTSDGFPTDLVRPGTSRDYTYPLRQRGATLWYHDHRMDHTGEQIYRGLFGMHVVRDADEDDLPLPHCDREIPLVIVDRSFDGEGQLHYPTMTGHSGMVDEHHVEGVLGDVMLVNGAAWPELEVDAARYRFRVLNGCNARRLDLVLDTAPGGDVPAFTQIGSDGGLLGKAVAHDHLQLAQAERFDVVVDFSAYPVGSRVELRNRFGSDRTAQVMRFVVARKSSDDSAPVSRLPDRLSGIQPVEAPRTVTRRWNFHRGDVDGRHGWLVNGRPFDPDEMQASVPRGRTERWRFQSDLRHPVHVHLDPFQVLSRGTGGPGEFDHGWKDTVDMSPGEFVDVAVRFSDYAGRYVIHCHNLEHEDRMMMAAFRTT